MTPPGPLSGSPSYHRCLFTRRKERPCWRLGSRRPADPAAMARARRSSVRRRTSSVSSSPAVVVLILLVVEWLFGDTLVAFASDLLRGLDAIPQWIIAAIVIGTRILGLIVLGGGLAWILYRRRWRMLATIAIAGAAGRGGLRLARPVGRDRSGARSGRGGRRSRAADDRGLRVDGGHRRRRRDAHRRRPVARPPGAPGRMGVDRRSRDHGVHPGAGVVRLDPGVDRRMALRGRGPRRRRGTITSTDRRKR